VADLGDIRFYQAVATALPTLAIAAAVQRREDWHRLGQRLSNDVGREEKVDRVISAVAALCLVAVIFFGEVSALAVLYRGHPRPHEGVGVWFAVACAALLILEPVVRALLAALAHPLPTRVIRALSVFASLVGVATMSGLLVFWWRS
jgi:hypothetical protein